MSMARPTLPPHLMRVVQIAVGIGLLVLLWRIADGPEAARILVQADPVWLIAAILALTVQTVLSALRWRLTGAQLGITLGRWHAVREYYLAQIVNQSLPGGMIGDAGRAVRARGQAGLMASGQAVVFERLAGQVAMFVTMAVAFLITFAAPGGLEWPAWLLPTVAVLLVSGVGLPLALLVATRLPGRAGAGLKTQMQSLVRALCTPRVLPGQIVLSIGTTVSILAAFAFCATAIGAVLPPIAIVTLVPLILFTMLIPITISGWGLREGAAAALFPIVGATASQGLAASVAFGLVFIVSVLPGVIAIWTRSGRQTMKP